MSRWTHIRGCIELVSEPYEFKKMKNAKPKAMRDEENDQEWREYWTEKRLKAYFPFPEEQFKITIPMFQDTYDHKPYTKVEVYEYSLPRARKYINQAFNLLPQGEIGWRPAIKQDSWDCSSSSNGSTYKCEDIAFQEALVKLYQDSDDRYKYFTFKDLKKTLNLGLCWFHYVENIVIGIREDVRYCSGFEMLEGLEKFFSYLEANGIEVEDGYLEWQDEYRPELIFAWRYSRVDFGVYHKYMILNAKDNNILYSKTLKDKLKPDGSIDWDSDEKVWIEEGNLESFKEKSDQED